MLRVKLPNTIPRPDKTQYRSYSNEALSSAYSAVIKEGTGFRKAARTFGVPVSTLYDRCSGKIDSDCNKSGPEPLLSKEEESQLVNHVQAMASFGYGYTRHDVVTIATDLAVHLGKKEQSEKPLSLHWFYGFMKRWPELKILKPRSLEIHRAKATSEETVNTYYRRLEVITQEHDLMNSPERIYNLDEKGLMENHTPLRVVSSMDAPISVTLPRSGTTTVIGCGNALGNAIPPYFIFKGQRMRDELLDGCLPGTGGTVSDSGWSNSEIFRNYLSEHFLRYSVHATKEKPVLILFDGHKSHISVSLSEWAKQRNLILFVLPAHTSHILQPMDVGCFGPFEKIYCNIRHKYMREHATRGVDRHSVCRLGCKAYSAALSSSNLQASFKKCGVYPFDKTVIDKLIFKPATVFKESVAPDVRSNVQVTQDIAPTSPCIHHVHRESTTPSTTTRQVSEEFFSRIDDKIFSDPKPTKKRKVMSAIVGGRAITDNDVLERMKDHQTSHSPANKKSRGPSSVRKAPSKQSRSTSVQVEPSTSGISKPTRTREVVSHDSSDSDVIDDDEEVCCQCKLFQPVQVRNCVSLIFVKWAECTHPNCKHWVHLQFCAPERTVRRHSEFWCPCHNEKEE